MILKRNNRITRGTSLLLTLWFTILTTNLLSAGTWLSPVAKGPAVDYAQCQCCCAESGGCSAECSCGGDPARENEMALRSCSGGSNSNHDAFVWVTVKFVTPLMTDYEEERQQHELCLESFKRPLTPPGQAPLKIPILG